MTRGRRTGFSLIEVMIVVVILGTLARIAIPQFQRVRLKAEAARVVGDFELVRVAAFEYNADTHVWPADVGPGVTPPELEPHLGSGFDFQRQGYQLDWENWMLPGGLPEHPGTGVLVGVSLVTTDQDLGLEVLNLLGERAATFTMADHYTYIFIGI